MDVEIKIKRYNPEADRKPHWESYEVTMEETDKVLDALHEVKWHLDGTLALRRFDVSIDRRARRVRLSLARPQGSPPSNSP